jgi:hypothetical protein
LPIFFFQCFFAIFNSVGFFFTTAPAASLAASPKHMEVKPEPEPTPTTAAAPTRKGKATVIIVASSASSDAESRDPRLSDGGGSSRGRRCPSCKWRPARWLSRQGGDQGGGPDLGSTVAPHAHGIGESSGGPGGPGGCGRRVAGRGCGP